MKWIMALQTAGVLTAAAAGITAGWGCSRLKKWYWASGYILSLLLLLLSALPHYVHGLTFLFPFSLLVAGRTEFVIIGLCAGIMLSTLIFKTDNPSYKRALAVFAAIVVGYYSIAPFLMPLILYSRHRSLGTTVRRGVCLQQTDYTCGPAAAVTALRKLGFPAEEGEIAIACFTTGVSGTQPDSLEAGLKRLYRGTGLECRFRFFNSIDELAQETGYTVAVIKFGLLVDHYVAVLRITDDVVVVGDPLKGQESYTHEAFGKIWRRMGVVLSRPGAQRK
jgi:hypothetical protein